MTTIEAIETSYAGYRFRSRLEARWAVLFDRVGIEWDYEPQGYEINMDGEKRPYLPDFWLRNVGDGIWAEVKGSPDGMDLRLLAYAAHPAHGLPANLSGARERRATVSRLLLLGPIPAEVPGMLPLHSVLTWRGKDPQPGVYSTAALLLGSFLLGTDLTGPVLGPDGTLYQSATGIWPEIAGEDRVPVGMPFAYRAARMARFEHGETPEPPTPSDPAPIGPDVHQRIAELGSRHGAA